MRLSNNHNYNKGNKKPTANKKTIYVYSSKKAIYVYLPKKGEAFVKVIGEAKKGKYSYALPIIPLYGEFYCAKEKKLYKAYELREFNVFLNVDEEDLKTLKGKELILWNIDKEKVLILGDDNGNNS